jgi:hypothetical protein
MTQTLPMLGNPLILNSDTGAALALGTFDRDPAFLCAVVADYQGSPVIWNLLDDESEAALLALLQDRAAARGSRGHPPFNPRPPSGFSGPGGRL